MSDEKRASDYYDIPLGAVLRMSKEGCSPGVDYVFIGWASNTVGLEAYLARNMRGVRSGYNCVWTYHCSYALTLARIFPDVEQYCKPEKKVARRARKSRSDRHSPEPAPQADAELPPDTKQGQRARTRDRG